MIDMVKVASIIIIHIMLYMMTGIIANKLISVKRSGVITIIVGFFSWYALLELIYIPVLIAGADIRVFHILQISLAIMAVVVFFIFFRRKIIKVCNNIVREIKDAGVPECIFLVIIFLLVLACIAGSKRCNSDFMHVISSIDMANEAGAMYLYDSDTGQQASGLNIMDALGVWNMSWNLWCRMFGISAMKTIRYCAGSLCLIISTSVYIRIGRNLFKGNAGYAFIFAGVLLGLMLFFITGNSPAAWLISYGGIPAACCTNVVIPFTLYWIMHIWRRKKSKADFSLLLIIELGSLAVSLQSLIVTLAMVIIALAADAVIKKTDIKYLFGRRM